MRRKKVLRSLTFQRNPNGLSPPPPFLITRRGDEGRGRGVVGVKPGTSLLPTLLRTCLPLDMDEKWRVCWLKNTFFTHVHAWEGVAAAAGFENAKI